MPVSPRLLPFALLAFVAAPAAAQDDKALAQAPDAVAEARAMIDAHRVDRRVGCGLPVPATYNAPAWQRHSAAIRRDAFEQCLRGVMAREENRLRGLEARISDLHDSSEDGDWGEVANAMAAKWDELEGLNDRLNNRMMWANTAERVLDTFTGPGAPLDSNRRTFNPSQPYRPYSPPPISHPQQSRTVFLPGVN